MDTEHIIANSIGVVEKAKSDKSKCRLCAKKIAKGDIRLRTLALPRRYQYSKMRYLYWCDSCAQKILSPILHRLMFPLGVE